MLTATINYLAVLVTAILGMVIGALWFSPVLFGNLWMKLSGFTQQDIEKTKKKGMAKNYIASFIGLLVMAYITSHFVDYAQAKTAIEGAVTGFWLWLGFIATATLSSILWEGKPVKLYILKNGHNLVILLLMGGILAVWV